MSINSRRKTIDGEERSLQDYEGNVLLIVNTASKCGFTPQKNSLHELYEEIGKGEFETLGFHVINSMRLQRGDCGFLFKNGEVSFPTMFGKVDVQGKHAHPLFQYLMTDTKIF